MNKKIKITLPIYYEIQYKTKKNKKILVWLNWYRNAFHILSNQVKKYYHNLVKEQIKIKINKIKEVKYTVYIKRKNTDFHNIRSIIEKFFLDWLVVNWIIADDSFDYIQKTSSEAFIDKQNPRIEITIIY